MVVTPATVIEESYMHAHLINFTLKYRFMVLLGIIALAGSGTYAYTKLPIDAFPDVSPVMVPIFAEAHGMAPEEVERLITFPIESAMNGLPDVTQVKSTSAFGMAAIYVYFADDVNIYFARQIVSERLNRALADLPPLHEPPTLGPISTGLGQIFIYYLTLEENSKTEGKDPLTYLREVNDWLVKFQLKTIPGVTEILSVGGHVLQFDVRVNPDALNKYNVTLEDVVEALRKNNRNASGQFIELYNEEYLVRGIGLLGDIDGIRNVRIKTINGIPIHIEDVAAVGYGKEIRRGVVSRNGEKEVVSGMVLQLYGENTSEVIKRLYAKISDVQASLPQGVKIVPYYEQAEIVKQATGTVKSALLQGAVLVIITLALFLGNFRSAFIVVLALPLCAMVAILCMQIAGVSANLMSLGGIAIAIGMLCDGTIVMIENIYRHLTHDKNTVRERLDVIFDASLEVGRPIVFSILIILMVFLPIFSMEGVERKMFGPMAFTITCALTGSIIVALLMAPALSSYLLKAGQTKEFILVRFLKRFYQPILKWAVRGKFAVLLFSIIAFIGSIALIPRLGTEFIPTLEEGTILISVTMPPSISLGKGVDVIQNLEKRILNFSPVKEVISRIGRPEAGSHPHPINTAEIHIELKPKAEWKNYSSKADLIKALNDELSKYPGVQLNFTQPIQNAFDELLSGIKAQLAVKIFGEDLNILNAKANEIKTSIDNIPGLVDLSVEQSSGQPQIRVDVDRAACITHGVDVSDIMEIVELGLGGEAIDFIYLNNRRFGLNVRFSEDSRAGLEAIQNLMVRNESGMLVPLKQVAKVEKKIGPTQINREKNQRRWVVQGNVRGRDLGSVVSDIQQRISEKIKLPPGYYIEYGGQFENQERAMRRLSIIVPIVIAAVFLLLCMTFGSFKNALLIITNIPLAMIGGILGLYFSGEYLSVPAAVGFIALFGIAVQNGIILVSCINQLRDEGYDLENAVIEGGLLRLRPVLMTALTTVLGLVPLLFAQGIGSEVQRPLAVVVVFGLTSATFLTLFAMPAFYHWFSDKFPQSNAA